MREGKGEREKSFIKRTLLIDLYVRTVEPPNKGHVGTRSFVLYREVSFIRRLKCTGIIGIGTSRFVLYREVFFIQSVLYRRFHCISIGIAQLQKFFLPPLQAHVLAATLVGLWRLRVIDGQIPSPYTR